jgi:putative ABC transport system substrate-binding protein
MKQLCPTILFIRRIFMRYGAWFFISFFFLLVLSVPCIAQGNTFKIEALQVTNIEPYEISYNSFIKELEENGIVQGKNLDIKRTIIDFDVEKAGLWKKILVLFRIRNEASRIAKEKPDLALTIGTPATKYAKDKIIAAGIPVVFTAVAIPEAAGCRSLTEAGQGFTGATLYMDMTDSLKIIKLAFPNIKTVGIVHSDDENAIAHVEEAQRCSTEAGLTFICKQVNKNDHITPAAQELIDQGAQAFAIPLDTYYGLRNYEASKELVEMAKTTKLPGISLALMKFPGAVLYVGADFGLIGSLSGRQAVKILLEGAQPETLPILMQEELKILVDTNQMKELGIQLPMEILQIAKSVE